MDDKKMSAKKEMLKKMAGKLRDSSFEGIGKSLKGKKLEKVTVMAPDKKGLKKGLTKAQQILKAKLGEEFFDEEEESEELEECPRCDGEGCEMCEEEEESEEEDEE